ncbi:MAG TPA: hypothetical protein DC057_20100 [Spirochaetia bacterium]|nr:hypothetical protein [Spirochaetia bacterium]
MTEQDKYIEYMINEYKQLVYIQVASEDYKDSGEYITIENATEMLQTALNDKGEASKKVYDEFYPNDCIGEKIRNATPTMMEVE